VCKALALWNSHSEGGHQPSGLTNETVMKLKEHVTNGLPAAIGTSPAETSCRKREELKLYGTHYYAVLGVQDAQSPRSECLVLRNPQNRYSDDKSAVTPTSLHRSGSLKPFSNKKRDLGHSNENDIGKGVTRASNDFLLETGDAVGGGVFITCELLRIPESIPEEDRMAVSP